LYLHVFSLVISFRNSERDGQSDRSNINLAYMITVPENAIPTLVDTKAPDLTIYGYVLRVMAVLQFTAT
jgi:hypothetical protein